MTKAIGFLALTRIEFDLVMVAAILTILGYSTNDKVVVYDRVRENLRKYKTMPLRDLIDLSINGNFNRIGNVDDCVFIASLPLAIFGRSRPFQALPGSCCSGLSSERRRRFSSRHPFCCFSANTGCGADTAVTEASEPGMAAAAVIRRRAALASVKRGAARPARPRQIAS